LYFSGRLMVIRATPSAASYNTSVRSMGVLKFVVAVTSCCYVVL
jgi:hypothetical protein